MFRRAGMPRPCLISARAGAAASGLTQHLPCSRSRRTSLDTRDAHAWENRHGRSAGLSRFTV
jgi:hypothetical protein